MPVSFRHILMVIIASFMCQFDRADEPRSSPTSAAADRAKAFLMHLSQGKVSDALKSWDSDVADEKLTARIEKMAAKLKSFGGITKVDVGIAEDRRIKAYQKQTGEKIDVVPVEIICGDGNLLLAVFSVRQKDGEFKIFQLESLKEWGGTASLDPELPYIH